METSFISEHSLEYMIAPQISAVLKHKFSKVIPIYYWSTREGSSISSKIHTEQKLQIMAVFPRRPKLEKNNTELIYGKINDSIIEFSGVAKSFGIPTIFCFPVITSFFDIDGDSILISMSVLTYDPLDIHFCVNKGTKKINFYDNQENRIEILNANSIIELAANAKEYCWNESITKMNELRNASRRSRNDYDRIWFVWMSQYKPIYFLLFK